MTMVQASAPSATRLDAQNPWPGLAAYDEASQAFFHGREEDATELLRLIHLAPLTVLYGNSGLGKSSLLQAGLFPRLRADHYLPVYLRVDFSDQADAPPLEQVARRLEEEITRVGGDCPRRAADEDLWQYLHRKDLEIWSADNHLLTPVLVFDQFEELFSRSGGNRARIDAVFHGLADLIENRIPAELAGEATDRERERERHARLDLLSQRYRILLAFREDFLPEVETWKDKVPSLLRNRLRLLPMSRAQAIAATELAGAAVLAPGVAARIVDFVASREGETSGGTSDRGLSAEPTIEPVLLSLCCTQLNRRRPTGGLIDSALLASAGQDILESFYREALAGMPERVPRFIETHLIQGDRYRGNYPRDEALARGDLTVEELATLTDRYRLLRVDQLADTARIELIHDRLVSIVRAARDARLAREREQEQQRLRQVAEAEAQHERERREQAELARARLARMRNGLLGLAILLVGALAAAFWWGNLARQAEQTALQANKLAADRAADAISQKGLARAAQVRAERSADLARAARDGEAKQRQLARSRELIAFTLQQLEHDPELSVLLASEAVKTVDDAESLGILRRALAESHVRKRFQASPVALGAAHFLDGGRRVVTSGKDGTVRVWDVAKSRMLAALKEHRNPIWRLWVSDDGRLIFAWSGKAERGSSNYYLTDSLVTAWRADTMALVWRMPLDRQVVDVHVSRCCRRLLIQIYDDLILADADSGREVARYHIDMLEGSGFADGGRTVLAAGYVSSTSGEFSMCNGRWQLRRWHADSGAPIGEPVQLPGNYGSVDVNEYGMDILSGSVGYAEMGNCGYMEKPYWLLMPEGKAQELLGSAHGGYSAFAFSPVDIREVAFASGPVVQVWKTAKSHQSNVIQTYVRHQLPLSTRPTAVDYSRDGELLLGGGDGEIRVWEIRFDEARERVTLHAKGHNLVSAVFSADGRHVLTAGADGSARLWELPQAQDRYDLSNPRSKVAVLCPRCRTTKDLLAFAANRVTRGFTNAEKRMYGIEKISK